MNKMQTLPGHLHLIMLAKLALPVSESWRRGATEPKRLPSVVKTRQLLRPSLFTSRCEGEIN